MRYLIATYRTQKARQHFLFIYGRAHTYYHEKPLSARQLVCTRTDISINLDAARPNALFNSVTLKLSFRWSDPRSGSTLFMSKTLSRDLPRHLCRPRPRFQQLHDLTRRSSKQTKRCIRGGTDETNFRVVELVD